MHTLSKKFGFSLVFIFIIGFAFNAVHAQEKRIKRPKKNCKIASVDGFVNYSFELYNKVFVYDSLAKAGVELTGEQEDLVFASVQRDADSLYQIFPTVLDDMTSSKSSIIKKAKATLNLNKAKKAIKYTGKTVKGYLAGEEEVTEEDNK